MAENKKAHSHDAASSFARFVREHVVPLSRAFAESPLMQLRVKTPQGSVTLAKAAPTGIGGHSASTDAAEVTKPVPARTAPAARIYNGQAGRAYDTINAEVVGIFRDVAQSPSSGDRLETGRVLGHIEALRLRNEVRCPVDCTLIAQVVVDGQPVDFGEALFVVDSGGAPMPQPVEDVEGAQVTEPPRV